MPRSGSSDSYEVLTYLGRKTDCGFDPLVSIQVLGPPRNRSISRKLLRHRGPRHPGPTVRARIGRGELPGLSCGRLRTRGVGILAVR